jgi:hypothetical protein
VGVDTDSGMIFCFDLNRNKPKLDLFRFCFGLFRKISHVKDMGMDMDMAVFLLFRFVSNGLWMLRLYRNTETSCFFI